MREMTLKDIQDVSVEILCIIDEFCTNNEIKYSLGYGALIGAVRHKGFIPWDDDIDIIMTRDNYTRFISLFNGYKGYKVYAPELGNCYHAIARVCEMDKTKVYKYYKWNNDNTGVWIDLFPYDALPVGGGKNVRKKADLCYAVCKAHIGVSRKFGFRQNYGNIKNFLRLGCHSREDAVKRYLEALQKDSVFTDKVINYASPYVYKDIHPKTVFDKYIRYPFYNKEFSIIASYDLYLSNLYGDYMTPPPPEKQVRGHNMNKFYWVE